MVAVSVDWSPTGWIVAVLGHFGGTFRCLGSVKRTDGDVPFVTFPGFRILLVLFFVLSHPLPFFSVFILSSFFVFFIFFFHCPARALRRASWLVGWHACELVVGVLDKTDWFTSHDRPVGTRQYFSTLKPVVNYVTKNHQEKMSYKIAVFLLGIQLPSGPWLSHPREYHFHLDNSLSSSLRISLS